MEKNYYEVIVERIVEELYTVYADSEEHAKDLVYSGCATFEHEMETKDFEVLDIEEIED